MSENGFSKDYYHRTPLANSNKITQITNNFLMEYNYCDVDVEKEARKSKQRSNQKIIYLQSHNHFIKGIN